MILLQFLTNFFFFALGIFVGALIMFKATTRMVENILDVMVDKTECKISRK
jgi:hypothetical protein